jgi:catechol 2,3-dioxygenase-like lactoylglutathione lyase family enzyme
MNSSNTGNAVVLGNFSVSLAVKDIEASRAFYQKIGFFAVMGDGKGWQIMRCGGATIGLFQGMFEKNLLTFNPGWDSEGNTLPQFTDVRELQKELKRRGITPLKVADEATTGPESFIVVDPDGNQILVDQHV